MKKFYFYLTLMALLVSGHLFGQTNSFPLPEVWESVSPAQPAPSISRAESGWGYSYFYWGSNSLVFGTRPGVYSNNRLELKPGGAAQGALHSSLDLYQSPSIDHHTLRIRLHSNGNTFFNGGNVGIGTTTPTHKLEVNGTICAKEVKLEATAWPDYVFQDGYQLMPLEEVKAHIDKKGHLPGLATFMQRASGFTPNTMYWVEHL